MKNRLTAGRSSSGIVAGVLLIGAVLFGLMRMMRHEELSLPEAKLAVRVAYKIHIEAGRQIQYIHDTSDLGAKQLIQAAARINDEAEKQIKKILDEASKK